MAELTPAQSDVLYVSDPFVLSQVLAKGDAVYPLFQVFSAYVCCIATGDIQILCHAASQRSVTGRH